MSAPALGVGIIGFGFMGHTHTYGLINIPLFYNPAPFKVKHISVCTPVAAERAAAEGLGYYRKVVADYRELIDDPEIDVIAVSSPNRFHKEQIIAAVQAGKHLYCDKPVVASLEDADEVFAAMRACNYQGKSQVVLQYERPQLDDSDPDAKKVIKATGGEKMLSGGTISLQSESHPVEFRKVELRKLAD